MDSTCEICGDWKSEDYDFCRDCNSEDVEIGFDLLARQTPKALLIVVDGDEVWLPKSQVADIKDDPDGGAVWIPRWLAAEKDLL